MELLSGLVDRFEWLVAGLVGAIISGWWHKASLIDVRGWLVFLITGVACAVFLTGIASNYLGVDEPRNITGIGFLLGSFGGSLIAAINRALWGADIWKFLMELVKGRLGG
ncbi:MFS transporter [Pseudomonas alliivorans]|nr:MFS transporter [Pseudomonas alliivorans]